MRRTRSSHYFDFRVRRGKRRDEVLAGGDALRDKRTDTPDSRNYLVIPRRGTREPPPLLRISFAISIPGCGNICPGE
jgi:hypothetical protein